VRTLGGKQRTKRTKPQASAVATKKMMGRKRRGTNIGENCSIYKIKKRPRSHAGATNKLVQQNAKNKQSAWMGAVET